MNLEAARPLVVFDEIVLVQDVGRCVHQVNSAPLQQGVRAAVVVGDAVQGGVAEHAHVQVGVAEPVDGVLASTRHKRLAVANHHQQPCCSRRSPWRSARSPGRSRR